MPFTPSPTTPGPQVVYTEGPVLRVHVRASKVEPGAPELSVVTNVFSFAFCSSSGPVRRVVPEAMVEALEYLQVRAKGKCLNDSQVVGLRWKYWSAHGTRVAGGGVGAGVCGLGVS